MRDTVPPAAVAGSTTKALPFSEYMAPRAKSAWPPLEDQYLPPTVSDAHWPTRSTSVVALIDTKQSSRAITLGRSEEHTSELQSLMRISYAVFCLKQKKSRT